MNFLPATLLHPPHPYIDLSNVCQVAWASKPLFNDACKWYNMVQCAGSWPFSAKVSRNFNEIHCCLTSSYIAMQFRSTAGGQGNTSTILVIHDIECIATIIICNFNIVITWLKFFAFVSCGQILEKNLQG